MEKNHQLAVGGYKESPWSALVNCISGPGIDFVSDFPAHFMFVGYIEINILFLHLIMRLTNLSFCRVRCPSLSSITDDSARCSTISMDKRILSTAGRSVSLADYTRSPATVSTRFDRARL